jgi:hypothetical protein
MSLNPIRRDACYWLLDDDISDIEDQGFDKAANIHVSNK